MLTMPITRGRLRSMGKRVVCQTGDDMTRRETENGAEAPLPSDQCLAQAVAGALSGLTGGVPPDDLLDEDDQSLGGRGGLPAMMSSICSVSIVSHSSRALAM